MTPLQSYLFSKGWLLFWCWARGLCYWSRILKNSLHLFTGWWSSSVLQRSSNSNSVFNLAHEIFMQRRRNQSMVVCPVHRGSARIVYFRRLCKFVKGLFHFWTSNKRLCCSSPYPCCQVNISFHRFCIVFVLCSYFPPSFKMFELFRSRNHQQWHKYTSLRQTFISCAFDTNGKTNWKTRLTRLLTRNLCSFAIYSDAGGLHSGIIHGRKKG